MLSHKSFDTCSSTVAVGGGERVDSLRSPAPPSQAGPRWFGVLSFFSLSFASRIFVTAARTHAQRAHTARACMRFAVKWRFLKGRQRTHAGPTTLMLMVLVITHRFFYLHVTKINYKRNNRNNSMCVQVRVTTARTSQAEKAGIVVAAWRGAA